MALAVPLAAAVVRHRCWTWTGIWQLSILGTLSVRAIGRLLSAGEVIEIISSQAILWFAGSWLAVRDRGTALRVWHVMCISLVVQNAMIAIFNLEQTVPALTLSSLMLCASASFPVWLIASGAIAIRGWMRVTVVVIAILAVVGAIYERWTVLLGLPLLSPGLWVELVLLVLAVVANQLNAGPVRPRYVDDTRGKMAVAEEILQTQNRLVSVGQLAAGAVHGVKNALSAIGLAADWGTAAGSDADAQRSLQLIRRNVRAAHQDLERLLGGMTDEDDSQVDVSELVQGAAESLRIAVRAERAAVELDLEAGLRVAIGSSDLAIAISNLVTNAAHAGRKSEATTIQILSRRSSSGMVAIDVIDNAGGMDADSAAAAFELGISGEDSTGVGLYLTRSLIERAGGNLTWHAVEGGSRFTIDLPEA